MQTDWTKVLGWPGYRVYDYQIDQTRRLLTLQVRRKRGNRKLTCAHCGRRVHDIRGVYERTVRDLPCFEFQTAVVVECYRIRCPDCGVKAERNPQLPSKAPYSKRFEDAVGEAAPIFVGAIEEMTVSDALGIIRGNKDAASQYFRRKTSGDLIAAFSPPVTSALDRAQATRYYAEIANTYNRLPLAFEKVDPDLTAYVVGKAVDALFDQIAREEVNIRANPLARTTDILRKVFGSK
jgi:hypothetical protein